LTAREHEVLDLVREGQTNPQIAKRLEISLETVKHHVSEILSKLDVPTREAAAEWALEKGGGLDRLSALGLMAKVTLVAAAAVALVGTGVLAWVIAFGPGGDSEENSAIETWLAAPAEPPADCAVSPTVHVRDDVAPGIEIGAVYMISGTAVAVNPRNPSGKALFIVSEAAGTEATVEGRNRGTGAPLVFVTSGRNSEVRSDKLVFDGPFIFRTSNEPSEVIPPGPGCYDVTATWDNGSATSTVYFYGSRSLCFPDPCP
jgi:Response regulator containing a CheY-like receiver domain and an HTH DNA-binding domain